MCGCERINSIAYENNAKTLTLRILELLSLSSAACFTRAATGSLSERTVWARTLIARNKCTALFQYIFARGRKIRTFTDPTFAVAGVDGRTWYMAQDKRQ